VSLKKQYWHLQLVLVVTAIGMWQWSRLPPKISYVKDFLTSSMVQHRSYKRTQGHFAHPVYTSNLYERQSLNFVLFCRSYTKYDRDTVCSIGLIHKIRQAQVFGPVTISHNSSLLVNKQQYDLAIRYRATISCSRKFCLSSHSLLWKKKNLFFSNL